MGYSCTDGVTKGACHRCKVVWFWKTGTRKLKDTLCPRCQGRLRTTTHLMKRFAWVPYDVEAREVVSQATKKDQFIEVPYHPGMRISFAQGIFEYTGTIKRVDRRRWASLDVQVDHGRGSCWVVLVWLSQVCWRRDPPRRAGPIRPHKSRRC